MVVVSSCGVERTARRYEETARDKEEQEEEKQQQQLTGLRKYSSILRITICAEVATNKAKTGPMMRVISRKLDLMVATSSLIRIPTKLD